MKILVRTLLVLLVLLAVVIPLSLHFAAIELTTAGAHKRLLVPLGFGTAKVMMPAGTGDAPRIAGHLDGPVITVGADGAWSARWFCGDKVQRSEGAARTLLLACEGRDYQFPVGLTAAKPAPAEIAMPARLMILSDVEGNSAWLDRALVNLGVMGSDGTWRYGAGHVVIAGDAVDRGRDVFAVLWRLYGLSQQARAAGGEVHLLLGNHEQYSLRGNTTRAHPDHLYALAELGGAAAAFGPDTVLGQWLRQQGVVLKAGRVLITHGGISPAVAASGLTPAQLNAAMRRYWQGEPSTSAELDAVLGPLGVTQYRGYLMDAPNQYSRATEADVGAALRAFGVDHIVVGHTIVEKVTGLFGNRVYAIDVNSNTAAPEALLFEDGVPRIVNTGAPRQLPEDTGRTRPFNIFASKDWGALSRVVSRSVELSQLPHPY